MAKTLSELNPLEDITADDVIANRVAQRKQIETLRTSANPNMRLMFFQFKELEMLGRSMGYDATFDENLDDDDFC